MKSRKPAIKKQEMPASDDTFGLMFASHAAVMLIIDPDTGVILDANQAAVNFYGYPKPKLCSMFINEINTLPAEKLVVELQKAATGEQSLFVFSHRLAGGEARTVEVLSSPVVLRDRKILFSIIHDITERKRAEEILQASEAKFRAVIDASPVPMALNDELQNITYLNPAFIQTFGYSLTDIPTLADWWPNACPDPSYRQWVFETWQARLDQARQTAKPFSPMEIRLRTKNGMRRTVLASVAALTDSFAGNHLVMLHDISTRKQMEDALRNSERKYQILFDTLNEGIALNEIIYDEQGEMIDYRILEVNQAFYSTADYNGVVVGSLATKLYGMTHETIKEFWREHKTRTTSKLTEMPSPIKGRHFIISTSPFVNGRFVTSFFDITERKRVEEELVKTKEQAEASEEKFKAITDQTAEGIALSDLEGNYLFVNPAFCKMTGYSESELLKMTVFDVKAKTQPHSSFFQSKTEKAGQAIEVNLRRKDGTEFYSEIIGNVININSQDIVLGTVRDISERRQAEESIKEMNWRLESIINGVNVGTWEWNVQTGETMFNKQWAQIIGYTLEELAPVSIKTWQKFTHPDDLKLSSALLERHFAGDIPYYEFDCRMKHKDGHWVWINDRGRVISRADDGQPLMMFGTHTDISERKKTEEQLRKLSNAAEQSQVSIIITDTSGSIEYVNPKFTQVTGYQPAEVIGRNPRFLKSGETTLEEYKRLWDTITTGGEWRGEFHNRRKNGELFWESTLISPVKDDGGRITHFVAVKEDTTERKQLVDSLLETRAQLSAIFSALADGVTVTNAGGQLIYANDVVAHLAGFSSAKEMLEGYSARDLTREYNLIDEDGNPFPTDKLPSRLVARGISAKPVVVGTVRPDQSIGWSVLKANPILDAQGRVKFVVTVASDITEVKHAEEARAASEAELRALFASMQDAVLVIDRDGVYRKIAPTNPNLLYKPSAELLGKNLREVFPAEQSEVFCSAIRQVLATRETVHLEYRLEIGGQTLWFEAAISMMDGDNTLWVARNITDRKQIEIALRTAEQNLRNIFENTFEGIGRATLDGRMLMANPALVRLNGYESEAELIASVNDISREWYVDPNRRSEFLRKLKEQGRVVNFESEVYRHKTRERIWIRENAWLAGDPLGGGQWVEAFIQEITDSKRAELALRDSEANLAAIFNATDEAIFLLAADKTLLALNDVGLKRVGKPRDLALGQNMADLMSAETVRSRQPYVDRALSTGQTVEFEDQRNGRYLLNRLRPILDADGKTARLAIYSRDITESRELHLALYESEEKYRTVANFTYDWETWRAPDGSYIYVSPACERICGHSASEFLEDQNLLLKITHLDDRSIVNEHYREVNQQFKEQNGQMDFRIITPDGRARWISHRCTPVYGDNGIWLGRRESNRDITDRKQMEQQLRAEHEFVTQILSLMGQGLTVTDADGRFEFVNPAYAKLFGYEPSEMLGKKPADVTLPEDRAILTEQRKMRMAGQASTYESHLIRADGSAAPVLVTGVPRERDGQYAGAIAVITDLTEQKRIEAELRDAKNQLEKALTREQKLSKTDALTGISNRRRLFEVAQQKFAVAKRYKQPLVIMMFDVDLFKDINDEFGHDLGDQVLSDVAAIAASEIRSADVIGRYGGDEFVILLPMTTAQQAYPLAERIRKNVEALRVPSEKGEISTTLSMGIVEYNPVSPAATAITLGGLFHRVDEAMYQSKNSGRNRVVILDGK